MFYQVKYKLTGQRFWRKIRRVKGDGFEQAAGIRFFITEDETRIEIPTSAIFILNRQRFQLIKSQLNKETGKVEL